MIPLPVAVALNVFSEPLRTSLRSAKRIGVQGVQLDVGGELQSAELSQTGRKQLLHELETLGLRAASLNFSTRRPFAELTELDSRVVLCREAMTLAHDLRAKVFTLRIGRFPPPEDGTDIDVLGGVLNDLADHGNRVGVTLAVTPSGDSAVRVREVLLPITSGPTGVDFDPAAFVLSGQLPLDAAHVLKEMIVNFTARDAVRDLAGAGVETLLGQGEVPWSEMFSLLEETNYGGWLTINRTQGDDKWHDVARAVTYLQNMLTG